MTGETSRRLPSRRRRGPAYRAHRGLQLRHDDFPPVGLYLTNARARLATTRFTDDDPAGDRIPGAVEGAFAAGVTVHALDRCAGRLRARWFHPRPPPEPTLFLLRAAFSP